MSFTDPNRRQVLCGLAVALVAPGALAACSTETPAAPTPAPAGGAGPSGAAAPPTSAAPAGPSVPLAQVPVGSGTVVEGTSGPVLVVQPTPGTVKAYNASCPHAGTTVDPPQNGTIVCPNHFSMFDAATGAVTTGPADTGLQEVPATVVNGTVQLA